MRAVFSAIDSLLSGIAALTRQPVSRIINIESSDSDFALVAKDGSLVSAIKVDGSTKMIGERELNDLVIQARLMFANYLSKPGHAIQIHYVRDPERSGSLVRRAIASQRANARRQTMDLEDLFSERERRMPKLLAWEALHFVLWTRAGLLSTEEMKDETRRKKTSPTPPKMTDGQWPLKAIENLRARHTAFVKGVQGAMGDFGIRATALSAREALVAARDSIYPDRIGQTWKPILPGDPIRPRLPSEDEIASTDHSCLFWPSIDKQLLDRDAQVISWSPSMVRIGDTSFAAVDMTVAPEEPLPFSNLLNKIIDTGEMMPWRMSALIEGGGMHAVAFQRMLASILTWASPDNKRIHAAMKELADFDLRGGTVSRLRISFATWAPAGDDNLLRKRAATLSQAVESWGNCMTSSLCGDPLEGWASSALLIDCASTAPSAASPLEEALRMMPWQRPACPWDRGSVLFRTPDGKMWPYEPGSSQQTTFIDLVFAPPGRGKSVLVNSVNLACCLVVQRNRNVALPRIAIIDVGPSSKGLVSLLREALPPDRRHEAMYERLRMTPEYAINPFDTQLGMRRPLPHERSFLTNFLTLITTPLDGKPYDAMEQLIGSVIDEVYNLCADVDAPGNPSAYGKPKPYSSRQDRRVDEAMKENDIRLPEDPTWWDVVDAFVARSLWHEAALAQRYAVPTLSDTLQAVRLQSIEDIYGEVRVGTTREPLPMAYTRIISAILREYAILAAPTRFDIGSARVCSLDLDEVAPRGGGQADRQTAVMYMLARYVLARDFFLNEELERMIPQPVKDYHIKRIREIRESSKRIVFDEFHRASAEAVRKQVVVDMREGRKWGVQVVLASQLLNDFDKTMIDMATGIWVLGTESEQSTNEVIRVFGLSETDRALLRRMGKPNAAGAPFLAVLSLKDDRYVQRLYNSLGPIELWALSTTAEDSEIRNRLYKKIGPKRSRALLAEIFPRGSAKDEVERRAAAMQDAGQEVFGKEDSIIDEIVEELVRADVQLRSNRRLTELEEEVERLSAALSETALTGSPPPTPAGAHPSAGKPKKGR